MFAHCTIMNRSVSRASACLPENTAWGKDIDIRFAIQVKGNRASPKVEVTVVAAPNVADTLVLAHGTIGEDEGAHCKTPQPFRISIKMPKGDIALAKFAME